LIKNKRVPQKRAMILNLWDDIISHINEIPIDLSPYADYFNTCIFKTDDEGFYYQGTKIDFSEIIPDPTEESPTTSSTS